MADLGSRQGQREERVYLASDLDPALFDGELADLVGSVDEVDWDEREGVLKAERQMAKQKASGLISAIPAF